MTGHAYFFIGNIAIIHNDKESILTLSHLLYLLLRGIAAKGRRGSWVLEPDWAIRSALREYAQGFESHTQSAQALCSSPQGRNEKTRRSGFLKILAETVSAKVMFAKRRLMPLRP
ncbi:hypothetical protein AKG95_17860 [Janthinobacterium lividum]|uniref:Uncharacterized protein n=2 Tax=Janthinobacterium lividum TaxID=29581 RepID=A0A1S1UBW1_9BURK|nr:hypothetical protein AKG95_17860 [Janthinobacterium lividum]